MEHLKVKLSVLFLVVFSSLFLLSSINAQELDATNIKLINDKILVENGHCPRWSPDGNKILYTILTVNGPEIWEMNSDGSKKIFIVKGTNGSWSPDGTKIVYLTKTSWSKFSVSIFDLKEKKILYQDNKEFDIQGPGVLMNEWDPDKLYWVGNKIYLVGYMESMWHNRDLDILDLDNLKWEDSQIKGYAIKFDRNLNMPDLELVQVLPYEIPYKHLSDYFRYNFLSLPRQLRGIWAISKHKNFYIILLPYATQFELSPSLNKLVYVKLLEEGSSYKTQIHCSELTRSSKSKRKLYEAELGANNGVKEDDILIIANPRINPLNNKIIGYTGNIKAWVTVKAVENNTCVILPEVIIQRFDVGDLAGYRETDIFGLIRKELSISVADFESKKNEQNREVMKTETKVKDEILTGDQNIPDTKTSKSSFINNIKKAQENITGSKNAYIRNDLKQWANYFVNALKILKDLYSNANNYEGVTQNDILTIGIAIEHLEKARECYIHPKPFKGPAKGYSETKKAEKVLENYLKANKRKE